MGRFSVKAFERRWDRWLVHGISFVAVFAYVCFVIRPHLLYDAFGIYLSYPEFSLDWACFRRSLSQAGGPTQYVAAFLSQWFYYPYAGALIVTAVAWLICLATNRLIRCMGDVNWWFFSLLPACAVLILYQTYHNPLAALVALATCLWFAIAFEKAPMHRNTAIGTAAFFVLCVGLYYLAGAVCVPFGILVGAWYAYTKRRIIQGGGIVLASVIVPWAVGTRLFYLTIDEAYSLTWPFGTGAASDIEPLPLHVLRGLFLFPLLVVLAVAPWQVLSLRVKRRWSSADRTQGARFKAPLLCRGPAFRVVVETLTLICAAKNQNVATRVLLRRMRRDMIYGRRAEELLRESSSVKDDWLMQVERLRSLRLNEDHTFRYAYSEQFMLENLLQSNHRNKMAFEYLMASYLLAKRPDRLVENLHRLDDFGYAEIPRHYEEAILIYADATGREVPLGERRIRPETIERFRDFVNHCRPRHEPRQIDMVALARDFGDTYWFYLVFGRSAAGGSP